MPLELSKQVTSKQIPWNKGKTYNLGFRGGGYSSIHQWLKKRFGKANYCESADCKKISKVFHWAKIKGKKYEHKRENFIWLCASCHKKMDYTEEEKLKNSRLRLGVKLSPAHRKAIKLATVGINKGNRNPIRPVMQIGLDGKEIRAWESLSDAANELGIHVSGISMVCKGKLHKTGNYIWKYLNK